jgi:hypothetical protein
MQATGDDGSSACNKDRSHTTFDWESTLVSVVARRFPFLLACSQPKKSSTKALEECIEDFL